MTHIPVKSSILTREESLILWQNYAISMLHDWSNSLPRLPPTITAKPVLEVEAWVHLRLSLSPFLGIHPDGIDAAWAELMSLSAESLGKDDDKQMSRKCLHKLLEKRRERLVITTNEFISTVCEAFTELKSLQENEVGFHVNRDSVEVLQVAESQIRQREFSLVDRKGQMTLRINDEIEDEARADGNAPLKSDALSKTLQSKVVAIDTADNMQISLSGETLELKLEEKVAQEGLDLKQIRAFDNSGSDADEPNTMTIEIDIWGQKELHRIGETFREGVRTVYELLESQTLAFGEKFDIPLDILNAQLEDGLSRIDFHVDHIISSLGTVVNKHLTDRAMTSASSSGPPPTLQPIPTDGQSKSTNQHRDQTLAPNRDYKTVDSAAGQSSSKQLRGDMGSNLNTKTAEPQREPQSPRKRKRPADDADAQEGRDETSRASSERKKSTPPPPSPSRRASPPTRIFKTPARKTKSQTPTSNRLSTNTQPASAPAALSKTTALSEEREKRAAVKGPVSAYLVEAAMNETEGRYGIDIWTKIPRKVKKERRGVE